MGKRKRYIPKPFESAKGQGDTSANIYDSMLRSAAWRALSPKQHDLYVACKNEYYHQRGSIDKRGVELEIRNDNRCFTLNREKWHRDGNGYKLYTNERLFYRDMGKLIEYGFIECVSNGRAEKRKNVYRFSEMWQKYGTNDFYVSDEVKTTTMLNSKLDSVKEAGHEDVGNEKIG